MIMPQYGMLTGSYIVMLGQFVLRYIVGIIGDVQVVETGVC